MKGFFYNAGRTLGDGARKVHWLFQSATGNQEKAWKAEQSVGRDVAREILQQANVDPDPAVATWLNEVGALLVQHLKPAGREYVFRSILMDQPNAFALPGGYVFVTRPLLKLCEGSHDKLAFVLGHELAHVVCGHAAHRVLAQSVMSATTLRWTPLGKLLRLPVAELLSFLLKQGYSRQQEREADQVASQLMRLSQFEIEQAVELLQGLQQAIGETEDNGYLASHPDMKERIRSLRSE